MAKPATNLVSNQHPHALTIVALFRDTKAGDIVSDADIAAATRAAPEIWRPAMMPAKRMLLEQHSIAIDRVRNIGYLHLKDFEVAGYGDRRMRHVRRHVKVTRRALAHGVKDFAALRPAEQTAYVLTSTVAAFVDEALGKKQVRETDGAVKNGQLTTGDFNKT